MEPYEDGKGIYIDNCVSINTRIARNIFIVVVWFGRWIAQRMNDEMI